VAQRAAKLWQQLGDSRARADALLLEGIALRLLGRWEEALVVLQEAVRLAREAGALYVCGHASYHIGYSYLQSGQWERAAATIAVALDLGKQSGNMVFYGSSSFLQGVLQYQRGDWTAARSWFLETQRHNGRATRVVIRAYAPYGQGLICVASSDVEEGARYLEEAISISQNGRLSFILHRAQRDLAEVELVQGQAVEAQVRLQPIIESPDCEQYNDITPMLPMLAWACIELGDERQAEALLDRALPQAEAQHHILAVLDILRIRALLSTRRERWEEGCQTLEQALVLARSMPHPYAEAKLLYVAGQLQAARRDTPAARENFLAALSNCTQLGERLYAVHIERDLTALG
jgi:tetratricopeptide (TPR) repeat protein